MYTIAYPSGTLQNDGATIEQNGQNAEYQAYVTWLAQGNAPTYLDDSASYMPRITVTAWQLMQELIAQGLYSSVDSQVNASGNQNTITGWTRAPYFNSDHPLTLQIGAALGKDAAQMYVLFQSAAGR
jgi:hypothetical protein